MGLGIFACALGRHKIEAEAVRQVHGQRVARCPRCSTALEDLGHNEWRPLANHDAGLSSRMLR